MPSDRQRERESHQYLRTTCGLIGFIVFFVAAFISFLVAEETGKYYEYTIIFAFVMLLITLFFFCCVLNESKKIRSYEVNEFESEQALLLEPQPEPEQEPSVPFWADKTRTDKRYTREVMKLPQKSSTETTSTENDTDPEQIELQNMAKSSTGHKEPMPGTSRESQDYDTTRFEDAAEFQFESTQAGPSKSLGSQYDDIPFMDKSSLSLFRSSKNSLNTDEEKQEDVSTALSRLSLDNTENQVSSMPSQDPSTADSESKCDDPSEHSEASKKQDEESKLESKKEA